MRLLSCTMFILCTSFAALAWSQYPYPQPYNYGGQIGFSHSSTVEEGVQRGMADIIRSQGAANLMNSEAAKNIEDARRQNIDNRMHATQTYFAQRQFNAQARAAERGPKPTQEDLIRLSNYHKPRKLSASELDPLSGSITWPAILRESFYQSDRNVLDQVYVERANNNGYLTADQILLLDQHSKSIMAELKGNLSRYPPQVYSQARSFLQSLAADPYLSS